MKSYPLYKTAGIRWLVRIPVHWQVKPLFAVLREREESNKGNIESNVLSLSYGKIIRRDLSQNFGLLPESFETYQIVYPGDIILRLTDLQNDKKSLRVGLVIEKGIITSAYTSLGSTWEIIPKYDYYLLHTYDLMKVFYNEGAGVRQSMTFRELRRMPILLPSLPEQQTIVDFLDQKTAQIDSLITKKQHQIELLQELRTALINQAITIGLNLDVPLKDSGIDWLGEIPNHWEVKQLKHVAWVNQRALTEQTPEENEIHYIDISGVDSTGIVNEPQVMNFKDAPSRARRIIKKKDIIISTVRTYLKSVAYIDSEDEKLVASTGFAALTAKSGVNSKYLYWLVTSHPFVETVTANSVGVGYPAITASDLSNIPVWLPPTFEEQQQISDYLHIKTTLIDGLVIKNQKQVALYKEYRTALISDAVTGKIDVRGEQ